MLCGFVALCTKLLFLLIKNVSKHVFKQKETPARGSRHDPPRMGSGNGGKKWLTVVEALGDGGGIVKDAVAEATGDERCDRRVTHHHHLTFVLQAFAGSCGGGMVERLGMRGVSLGARHRRCGLSGSRFPLRRSYHDCGGGVLQWPGEHGPFWVLL
jgi:hypothetical protein